uniref:Uncharacterized protein n=1 Tax=Morchella importuna TaxID=1174673 RepID=A0A650AF87_9PEZI|nr:hypothetical protein [Morchella importuna]QGN66693.1 hypothetical protein [Morchella importuna]
MYAKFVPHPTPPHPTPLGAVQTFFFYFDFLFLFHHLRYMIACAGFSETWLVQYRPSKAGVGRGCSHAYFFLLVKKKWPLKVPQSVPPPRLRRSRGDALGSACMLASS